MLRKEARKKTETIGSILFLVIAAVMAFAVMADDAEGGPIIAVVDGYCTYGNGPFTGQPAVGATVIIENMTVGGGTVSTTTDGSGYYQYDLGSLFGPGWDEGDPIQIRVWSNISGFEYYGQVDGFVPATSVSYDVTLYYEWYFKLPSEGTPSGMPDFPAMAVNPGDSPYNASAATAVANCLWWFNCSDPLYYGLVPSFFDPPGLAQELRAYIDLAVDPNFPNSSEMAAAIQQWLDTPPGPGGWSDILEVHYRSIPELNFTYIEDELERCQDVILICEDVTGSPYYFTCAGVNSSGGILALSDPLFDMAQQFGWPGRFVDAPPDHWNPANVSHDFYMVDMALGFDHPRLGYLLIVDAVFLSPLYECGVNLTKTVWDPDTMDWVDYLIAPYCTDVRFNITVENTGIRANLTNIWVYDTLDASLSYTNSATVNGVPHEPEFQDHVNKDYIWQVLPDLEPGEKFYIEFDAHVDKSGHNDTNEATVKAWCEYDNDFIYDSDNASVFGTNVVVPEVTIHCFSTSSLLPDTQTREHVAIAGEQWIAQITISNHDGAEEVTDITVNITVPIGATYTNDTDSGTLVTGAGPNGEDVIECKLDNLSINETVSFDVAFVVDSGYVINTPTGERPICCNATVTGEAADLAENRADFEINVSDCDLVKARSDLKVTKIAKPDEEVRAGETFGYFIYVENLGPSNATGVTVTDTIISDTFFTDKFFTITSIAAADYSVPATPVTDNNVQFTLTRNSEMNPGVQDLIIIQVRANETQDINNIVRVSSSSLDHDMSNNQDGVMTAVIDAAELQILKSVLTPGVPWIAGTDGVFRLFVTNVGPSTAENVVVKDYLPSGVTVVKVEVRNGSCITGIPGDPSAPLTWTVGTLTPHDYSLANVTIHIDPDYPIDPGLGFGYLENDAVVSSDIFDPDNKKTGVHKIIKVEAEANLTLTKTAAPDPVLAGDILEYFCNVTNNGPSTARDVILTDNLPNEIDFISAFATVDSASCTYSATQHMVTYDIDDMEPGGTVNITVRTQVHSDVANDTTITNNADVISSTSDPSTPNTDSEDTLVQTQADLEIQKTSLPIKASKDEQIKYTIRVINHGPSDAQEVNITDILPKGVRFEIETLCNSTLISECPDIVNFSLGTLKAGEIREFDIWVQVLGYGRCCQCGVPVGTTMINEVCVESNTSDPVLDNNCATAKTLKIDEPDDEGKNQWYLFGQILLVGGLVSAAAVITYRKKRNHNH